MNVTSYEARQAQRTGTQYRRHQGSNPDGYDSAWGMGQRPRARRRNAGTLYATICPKRETRQKTPRQKHQLAQRTGHVILVPANLKPASCCLDAMFLNFLR